MKHRLMRFIARCSVAMAESDCCCCERTDSEHAHMQVRANVNYAISTCELSSQQSSASMTNTLALQLSGLRYHHQEIQFEALPGYKTPVYKENSAWCGSRSVISQSTNANPFSIFWPKETTRDFRISILSPLVYACLSRTATVSYLQPQRTSTAVVKGFRVTFYPPRITSMSAVMLPRNIYTYVHANVIAVWTFHSVIKCRRVQPLIPARPL
jgi:hypothetical protein